MKRQKMLQDRTCIVHVPQPGKKSFAFALRVVVVFVVVVCVYSLCVVVVVVWVTNKPCKCPPPKGTSGKAGWRW